MNVAEALAAAVRHVAGDGMTQPAMAARRDAHLAIRVFLEALAEDQDERMAFPSTLLREVVEAGVRGMKIAGQQIPQRALDRADEFLRTRECFFTPDNLTMFFRIDIESREIRDRLAKRLCDQWVREGRASKMKHFDVWIYYPPRRT
jgi:hypothetical protein